MHDATPGGYRLTLSTALDRPDWDRFLTGAPSGHHLQSTYWAAVKSTAGWRAARITVARGPRIVAGFQLLLRRVPLVGSIGYVPLGPVLGDDDPVVRDLILRGIRLVSHRYRLLYLVVQPSFGQEALSDGLRALGFRRARDAVTPYPAATAIVDLTRDEGPLLAAMKAKTRYNIRLAERKGVIVRRGHEPADCATFHRLLTMTGRRQHFPIPPERYFQDLLRIMAPPGHATLFLSEFEGQPLSAVLLIAFGTTVSYKRGGWSGTCGDLHPNELTHWTAMRWARSQGYRSYDLEGVDRASVRAVASGTPSNQARPDSVSGFKLGFGGDVVVAPEAYERVHPALRGGYDRLIRVEGSAPARRLVAAVRLG